MGLIDTHCHLYLEHFDADRELLIDTARELGVTALLLPNIDQTSVPALHKVCEQFPDFCYPMMGLHPTSVGSNYVAELKMLESLLPKRKYYGVGEIGIDLYWDKTYMKEQIEAFEEQLRWSIELSLPVSIHTRNAFPEVFESLHRVGADKLKGVFHSFTGGEVEAKEALSFKNFKLGINGIVTYKNTDLSEVLSTYATIHDVVLETDAPYLSPVPYRGKRNSPAYLLETAKKVAQVFDVEVNYALMIIERNSKDIYSI